MRFEKKFVAVVGLAPTTCGLVLAALPLLSYTAYHLYMGFFFNTDPTAPTSRQTFALMSVQKR